MSTADNKAVFLSYASQDAEAAKRICEALRAAGVEVWFDQSELVGGDQWDAKIRGQIGACGLFLPLISANTQARLEGYFRLEWKLAEDRSHLMAKGRPFILPVAVDATSERDAEAPDAFVKVQWTRLPGGETPPAFVRRIQTLLGGPEMEAGRPRPAERGSDFAKASTDKEGAAAPKTSAPVIPGWMWGVTATVLGLVVLGIFLLRQPAPVAAPAVNATGPRPPPAAAPVDPKSIAVLPFANMSEDKDNAFFADGMHEDILTNLGVVRELHVTSRTSVLQYRGTTKSIRQIGAELGVAYVLEGSVRRAGNKVRVTGQLINARTDEHVWAKAYDRDLTDIFAIQSELSQAIAAALSAALSPQEKTLLENRPTTNLAAYDLFLKARANYFGNSSDLSAAQVEELLREAVKLDPAFAQAWAYLAWRHARAYFDEEDHSSERLAQAKAAIETAVRLAPDDPEVIEKQGNYFYYGYRDYGRAAEQYHRLLLLRPNSDKAYAQLGYLYRRQGRWVDGLASLHEAVRLDPRYLGHARSVADTLTSMRRYDEAAAAWRRATELAAGDPVIACNVPWMAFAARGSTREMDEWLAGQKADAADETKLLLNRRSWARARGDWAQAVEIDRQHPYLDPWDDPHWSQDAAAIGDLVGAGELTAARTQAKKLMPTLQALVEKQPANARLWTALAFLHAFNGDKESALRCARKPLELLPERADAVIGPTSSLTMAQIRAWTGDKDGALAELARLLRVPFGDFPLNVYSARHDVGWLPLHGDPRFETLLNDPQNNAPLF